MHKEIYLIQGLQDENYSGFHSRISGMVEFIAETLKPRGLKYTITAKAPPAVSIIPFSKKLMTAVSVYKEETHPVSNLIDADGFYGAYRVTEALPVTYTKDWTDGDATPGACLLTLFCKKRISITTNSLTGGTTATLHYPFAIIRYGTIIEM